MSKFLNTTNRTIIWFKKAHESHDLEMTPPFQRNPVWILPQKSYLIDSILNGFPIPEIYMQEFVDELGKERHILIDGQQRIRTCLEFVEGLFQIKEEESQKWGGMKFEDLSPDDKKKVFSYTFIVRLLPEMSDENIREIFQRLNKNVVALNAQELRQATYWGPFINTMQEIANYSYWNTTGIFTPADTRRMLDIEYISEISIAILNGHQNKKESLDKYYQLYEEDFEGKDDLINAFQKTIFEMEQLFPDIKNTRWRKKTDFYSLFVFFAEKSPYFPLSPATGLELRKVLDDFSKEVSKFLSTKSEDSDFTTNNEVNPNVIEYAKSIRASSDIGNRKRRHVALVNTTKYIFDAIEQKADLPISPSQVGLFEAVNIDAE